MKIKVYSRRNIESLPETEMPHVVISVYNSASEPARVAEGGGCQAVLRLSFDDLRRPMPDYPQFKEFSLEDARKVWAFVDRYKDSVDELRIHCDKGRSRSPGIAAAIAKVLKGHHEGFFKSCSPNMLVYNRMIQARTLSK